MCGVKAMQIGTQTFGLAKELNTDLIGTLQTLREIGFEQIEPYLLFSEKQGKRAKNIWAKDTLNTALPVLRDLGMGTPSFHIGIGYGWLSMPVGMITKNLFALQEKTGTSTFVISGLFGTAAQTKHWAKLFDEIQKSVSGNGIQILCHTHDDEFKKIPYKGEFKEALAVFFDRMESNIKLQLDIGWAALAGDEVSIAKRYADRIVSLHLKDFYPGCRGNYTRRTVPETQFAPIGCGEVRHTEVIALRDQFKHYNGSLIIDQDKYTGNMLDSLRIGYENIRSAIEEDAKK